MSGPGPDRFARLATILDEAPAEADPVALAAWLDAACGDDAELREQASELLEHRAAVPTAFLSPPHAGMAERPVPDRIGPFHVTGRIGRGGMGEVFRARDPETDRDVAIKVVHAAAATDGVLARFENERRMLARMSHPGIARVWSVGRTEDGEPWLAMELVPDPVDVVTDAGRRGLGLRERIELMAGVCDAMHHAHQKGVVHRDLKPGNVVVSGAEGDADAAGAGDAAEAPRPRVIDFGVARLVDEAATLDFRTRAGQLIGTQAYMAPEQARDPTAADVRSDVFALGTILYELLTGRRAFRSAGGPPAVPPAAAGGPFAIPADLDLVVRTAIAEDPELRYGSAEALAADLRRVLADEPVAARPPTAAYVVRKFVRRHRTAVAASVAGIVLLAAVAAVATAQAIRASRAEAATARFAYRTGIIAAAAAIADRDGAAAAAFLDEVPVDRRGWEWWHLDRLARGHLEEVQVSAVWTETIDRDADGRIVVKPQIGGLGRTTEPPRRVGDLLVLAGDGLSVDRSTRRALAWAEEEIRVVDTVRGEPLALHEPPFEVAAARLDGERILALGTDGILRESETATARETATPAAWTELAVLEGLRLDDPGEAGAATVVALGRLEDERVVVLTTRELRTVDPAGGTPPLRVAFDGAHGRPAISPGGRLVASGREDGTVRVHDAATGTLRHEVAAPEPPVALAIDDDGTRVAVGADDGSAMVLDVATGDLLGRRRIGHAGAVTAVSLDPGGRLLTADFAGALRTWEVEEAWPLPVELPHALAVTDVAFAADGGLRTLSLADGLRTWTSPGREPAARSRVPAGTWRMQALPDGGLAHGTIHGRVVIERDGGLSPVAGLSGGLVESMAVSPDGTRLAVASTSGGGAVIDLASLAVRRLPSWREDGRTPAAFDVAWLDDRTVLLVEQGVGVVAHVLQGQTRSEVRHRLAAPRVIAVADRGRIFVGTSTGELQEIDGRTGTVRRRIGGHHRAVTAIVVVPDADRLVTADGAGVVVLRDLRDGRPLLRLGDDTFGGVLALAVSPDGRAIAAGHVDDVARVWAIGPPWGPPSRRASSR